MRRPCACGLPRAAHASPDLRVLALLLGFAGCDGYRRPPRSQRGVPVAFQLSTIDLAEFAARCRPDWEPSRIEGALTGARSNGWASEKILAEMVRLILDPAAQPKDLAGAGQSRRPGSDPVAGADVRAAALAQMRAALPRDGAL